MNFKKTFDKEKLIILPKGISINKVVDLIITDSNYFNKKIYYTYLKSYNYLFDKVKYGEFFIEDKSNLFDITNVITKPSNFYRKFTILGGWQLFQLEELKKEKFKSFKRIKYNEIIAETYNYQIFDNFEQILEFIIDYKNNFFLKYKDNELLNTYTIDEIMIIGSLIEKEGKSDQDKRLISSVIFNRLEKNMKLQIDATTIFSITKGEFKLDRKLNYNDLKIKDKFNTYYIQGLPPEPICYVSRKTIEIIFENYKSNFLFYFFDEKNQKHVFSETYKKHRKLLNEYRKN